jgi:predicted ArsR family transcriptional regulator
VYEYVAGAGDWVSRDGVAAGTGLERGTAVHHLDRLAADGLLETEFRRVSGRRGPGAGRPAKLYRRSDHDFGVTLPPREYEVVGRMLAAAVDRVRRDGADIDLALEEAASAEGARLARAARERSSGPPDGADEDPLLGALVDRGYEPVALDDGTVVLRNCPFHHLAKDHTELVCNMNLCLVGGTLDELGDGRLQARLEPEDGMCCVKLRPRTRPPTA